MISSVAEQYEIHPQTLRLYEREGLLRPSRSEGNTRLYTDGDLERLEVILHLTRDRELAAHARTPGPDERNSLIPVIHFPSGKNTSRR